MKILVVTQYFWPENFRINDLCLGLIERGNEVTVLTGIPNYPKGKIYEGYGFFKKNDEVWNGIRIYRSKLIPRGKSGISLILNYFSFAFFAAVKGLFLKENFDKIFVYQLSPVTVGLPAMLISKVKKIDYYFFVQDLWPESLKAAGGIKNKYVLEFFNKITILIYKNSKKILVQSEAFKDYIMNQGIDAGKLIFYPNSTESFYQPLSMNENYSEKIPKGFRIIFAGNLGEAQSLPTILDAAKIVKEKGYNVKWIFLGEGRMKEQIYSLIEKNQLSEEVHLIGAFPSQEMPYFFACADALLISLKKDVIFSLTIPSKVQSYLACAKPIIASIDGEAARIINLSKSGLCSAAEDSSALAKNVCDIYNMTAEQRQNLGANALLYYKREFEREMLLTKLLAILNIKP